MPEQTWNPAYGEDPEKIEQRLRDLDAKISEMYVQRKEAQSKYTYFLLAAVGASIAVSVRITEAALVSWPQILLACAVICWLASFWYGCKSIQSIDMHAGANMQYLRIQPTDGSKEWGGACGEALEAMTKYNRSARRESSLQFRWLAGGVGFFIAWHITEMVLRTIE